MVTLVMGVLGVVAFVLGTVILGVWLRRNPSVAAADQASRVMHFLFFAGLGAPFLVATVYPGLTRLDSVAGLEPLPWRPLTLGLGVILSVPGVYLLGVSNQLLRTRGDGANAFRLTKHVVGHEIYGYTRNPMSLGYYLAALGLSLLVGSTVLTLYVLVGVIPAHLFFLTFFEERELELRFGESYRQYRQTVPFLIPRRLER
ncbi:MAG: isoprenylcysteine carboxylmethyltransferase family protein [Chloroflexi bacterium]|nr:isoprenylcysteine carboxylmethyltransferase family protein [Chloroflexota bacterium]